MVTGQDGALKCFFALAFVLLRAAGTPIATGYGSAILQNGLLKFREHRENDGKGKHILTGALDHVTTKQHPHLSTIKKLLQNVSTSLTKNGIDHHITGGTLIGWKRNKKIIPWDGDADMAIISVEKMNKAVWGKEGDIGKGPLAKELRQKGITIVIGGYPVDGVPSIYRIMRNGVKNHKYKNARGQYMDLYMYNNCKGEACEIYDDNGATAQMDKVVYDSKGKLGQCTFVKEVDGDFDLTLPCPADVDGTLSSIYPGVDLNKPEYAWSDAQGYYVKT